MKIKNELEALELAVQAAAKSPCTKSKRGVVIWNEGYGNDSDRYAMGFNGPPPGFICDGSDECRNACSRLCVHAEPRALMKAPRGSTDLLHVKVVNGVAVPSGPPSCELCSKAILDFGIRRVWLLQETGLRLYSAEDFHVQSLLHHELPIIRVPGTITPPEEGRGE